MTRNSKGARVPQRDAMRLVQSNPIKELLWLADCADSSAMDADRMTTGNFMHNKNNIRSSCETIRDQMRFVVALLKKKRPPTPSKSAEMKKVLKRWIALEWQEFKGGEPVNLYALAKARIAVRDAFLKLNRASKPARRGEGRGM